MLEETYTFKVPFVIYDHTELADQNGHICSCENKSIALAVAKSLASWHNSTWTEE